MSVYSDFIEARGAVGLTHTKIERHSILQDNEQGSTGPIE